MRYSRARVSASFFSVFGVATLLGRGISNGEERKGLRVVLGRWLSSLLYGVGKADPLTLLCTALILPMVAVIASYVPVRRAASVDPMEALRPGGSWWSGIESSALTPGFLRIMWALDW